jgi:hypothetical protein
MALMLMEKVVVDLGSLQMHPLLSASAASLNHSQIFIMTHNHDVQLQPTISPLAESDR